MSNTRTPSQSFYMRGSATKYVAQTPEKITKVTGNSGVKFTPISKSCSHNTRIKTDAIDTVQRGQESNHLKDYIYELEQKVQCLEENEIEVQKYLQIAQIEYRKQHQLEQRILSLISDNYLLNQKINQNAKVIAENEQLKQLVYEQQAKILEQNQEIDDLHSKLSTDDKSHQNRKHCSFSQYFQRQSQQQC